jgi:THAP4-like, heme-binding beta-barrel domain
VSERVARDYVVSGPLVPALEPLACLLGEWRGGGHGEYPTIDAFDYGERMRFEHVGDGFLISSQRSWLAADGSPLHFERGFWRPGASDDRVEVTLAHPLGLTEVSEGIVSTTAGGTTIELSSSEIGRTSTGMDVAGLVRRYRIEGDVMRYEIDMATGVTAMTRHLSAELHREPN